jgi:ribosomal protein S11
MFTVKSITGTQGYWRYDVVSTTGAIALAGVTDPRWPDSPYAAQMAAKYAADHMNDDSAQGGGKPVEVTA